jgi:hypothetical protein
MFLHNTESCFKQIHKIQNRSTPLVIRKHLLHYDQLMFACKFWDMAFILLSKFIFLGIIESEAFVVKWGTLTFDCGINLLGENTNVTDYKPRTYITCLNSLACYKRLEN